MRPSLAITLVGLAGTLLVSGCRARTHLIEEPRVDLSVSDGNRGYLMGTAPASTGPWKTTRQLVETEVEIPPLSRVGRAPTAPASLETDSSPAEEIATEDAAPAEAFDSYVVKQGDTLGLIAARPDIYGRAGQWRRIYDANRDGLKDPNYVRPGMVLRIPRGSVSAPPPESASDSGTFTK